MKTQSYRVGLVVMLIGLALYVGAISVMLLYPHENGLPAQCRGRGQRSEVSRHYLISELTLDGRDFCLQFSYVGVAWRRHQALSRGLTALGFHRAGVVTKPICPSGEPLFPREFPVSSEVKLPTPAAMLEVDTIVAR